MSSFPSFGARILAICVALSLTLCACSTQSARTHPYSLEGAGREVIVLPRPGFRVEPGNNLEAALATLASSRTPEAERTFSDALIRSYVYLESFDTRDVEPGLELVRIVSLGDNVKALALYTSEARLREYSGDGSRLEPRVVCGATALHYRDPNLWVALNHGLPSATYLPPNFVNRLAGVEEGYVLLPGASASSDRC